MNTEYYIIAVKFTIYETGEVFVVNSEEEEFNQSPAEIQPIYLDYFTLQVTEDSSLYNNTSKYFTTSAQIVFLNSWI